MLLQLYIFTLATFHREYLFNEKQDSGSKKKCHLRTNLSQTRGFFLIFFCTLFFFHILQVIRFFFFLKKKEKKHGRAVKLALNAYYVI